MDDIKNKTDKNKRSSVLVWDTPPSQNEVNKRKAEALKWWRQKIRVLRGPFTARSILKRTRDQFSPRPGQFVLLEYSAKHADTLPYWDRFPLGVVLEVYDDGWLCFNLHYLPIRMRWKAFSIIRGMVATKNPRKNTRAKITYAVFKSISKLSIYKAGLKKHLFSHMVRKPVRIPWNEAAEYAIYLDIEQWMVGHSPSNVRRMVYRDTRLRAR